ncbi:MAG: Flp pilus assembly complex ATPase component TadA [Comamonadaceae bacterium]|nr:Flp pilus assembly complex ATPase component TadA [Comamonadaceae bacterium]
MTIFSKTIVSTRSPSSSFPGKPEVDSLSDKNVYFENITAVTGERFQLRLKPGQKLTAGFYGYPIDPNCDFRAVFFSNNGLSNRESYRPIGEILTAYGLVAPEDIDSALVRQKRLRSKRVGEILAEQHKLSQVTVDQTLQQAQKPPQEFRLRQGRRTAHRGRAGDPTAGPGGSCHPSLGQTQAHRHHLIELGLVTEEQLLSALARKFGLQLIDLDQVTPTPEALKRIPREILAKMQVLPLEIRRQPLVVATANPTDPEIVRRLRFAADCPIELVVAGSRQIDAQLARLCDSQLLRIEELIDSLDQVDVLIEEEPESDRVTESDSKVINLVNKVLLDAHRLGASDIHFEPGMGHLAMKIRYRRDGLCTQVHKIASTYKAAVISRIKIMAKPRHRRAPHAPGRQDQVQAARPDTTSSCRVATIPTAGGIEDVVMRILAAGASRCRSTRWACPSATCDELRDAHAASPTA